MANLDIRPAAPDEVTTVVRLYNLMWTGAPLDLKMGRRFFERVQNSPDHDLYVATSDDRIVGVFSLLIEKTDPPGRRCQVQLDNVAVHPRYRGQGIGRAIIGFVKKRCREAGCERVLHGTRPGQAGASGFYESLGFEHEGHYLVLKLDR